jgi:hypothetical protein
MQAAAIGQFAPVAMVLIRLVQDVANRYAAFAVEQAGSCAHFIEPCPMSIAELRLARGGRDIGTKNQDDEYHHGAQNRPAPAIAFHRP